MELITNGVAMRVIERQQPAEIKGLGPKQIEWCRRRFPYFEHNRVVRLADHERAAAAYRIAGLIDDARERLSEEMI